MAAITTTKSTAKTTAKPKRSKTGEAALRDLRNYGVSTGGANVGG